MSCITAEGLFLPRDKVSDFCRDACDFFIKKAGKERENKQLSSFCLDKALSFLLYRDHIRLMCQWI